MLTELMLICDTHFDVKGSSDEFYSKYLFDLSKSNSEFNPPPPASSTVHMHCAAQVIVYTDTPLVLSLFLFFVLFFI